MHQGLHFESLTCFEGILRSFIIEIPVTGLRAVNYYLNNIGACRLSEPSDNLKWKQLLR